MTRPAPPGVPATRELDVTTLAELTGAAIPSASQQLAKLRAAGVVTARRDGRRQLYRVEDPHIVQVIEQMFSYIAPDGTIAPDPKPATPAPKAPFTGNAVAPDTPDHETNWRPTNRSAAGLLACGPCQHTVDHDVDGEAEPFVDVSGDELWRRGR